MEFPFGHPNHRQHRRDDENPDEFRRPPYGGSYGGDYPPPQNYPPPPSYGGGDFPPPSYGGGGDFPPPSYGGGGDFPPPSYGGGYGGGDFAPPPPHVAAVHHASHTPHYDSPNYPSHQPSYGHDQFGGPPPPHLGSQHYPPPPQHQSSFDEDESGGGSHRFRPHMPGFIADHFHHSSSDVDAPSSHHDSYGGSNDGGGFGGVDLKGYFANKPTYKVLCKASDDSYSVAIRDDKVILTYTDPSDPTQHWYKDEKYSTKVKDEDGYPGFSLVNKATGEALKHSVSGHPVQLTPYKPDKLDEAVLWTESKDLGSGFRTIRTVNNVQMVLDAFNGDEDHGGVHDGTFLALYKCWKGDNKNQQWKLYPHSRE